jgi:hypothetical protein
MANIKQKIKALKEWMVENKLPKINPKVSSDIIAKGITKKYK